MTDSNVKRKLFHWNSDKLFTICSQIACTVFPFFYLLIFFSFINMISNILYFSNFGKGHLGIICSTFCHLLRFILLSFHLTYRIHVQIQAISYVTRDPWGKFSRYFWVDTACHKMTKGHNMKTRFLNGTSKDKFLRWEWTLNSQVDFPQIFWMSSLFVMGCGLIWFREIS